MTCLASSPKHLRHRGEKMKMGVMREEKDKRKIIKWRNRGPRKYLDLLS